MVILRSDRERNPGRPGFLCTAQREWDELGARESCPLCGAVVPFRWGPVSSELEQRIRAAIASPPPGCHRVGFELALDGQGRVKRHRLHSARGRLCRGLEEL